MENVAGSSSGTQLVKVKFVLEKRCEFGQHFNVVGDDELFGAWNPEASIPMQWFEGHIWTTEMEVFAGKRVEFKVILVGGESGVDWQPGPNRVLETSEASTFPVVLEIHWGEYDSFQKCSMPSSETAEIESVTAPTAFEQLSSDSVMNLDGLDFLAYDDKCENTTVDGHSVEMLTEGCLEKEVVVYDGNEFVHLTDFAPDPVTKGKITRRFKNLKESYMHSYSPTICMKHQMGGCNLVPKHIAFLFYLGLLIDTQPQDPQIHSETEQETSEADAPISFQSVSTIENLDKAEKLEEEPIDLAIEEKESANLDVALFRATKVVDEPTEDISISENSLTLVHLPFFHINGKDYITLHSIQSLFNIREDYCIAAIAEASQVEGESKEEFLSLDLETSNQKFLEAPYAFGLCLKRVAKEESALKDEDFETRLVELGIEKFGRNIVEPDKINSDMGAKINLEHEGQIEADELQKMNANSS
ncbi:hypothetical protein L7F22_064932 [Adiantum nelumboides]|nr:hypothetical protein [Adiantum nelumboides]